MSLHAIGAAIDRSAAGIEGKAPPSARPEVLDASGRGEVVVPGRDFIVHADYQRVGHDLVLSEGGRQVVLQGYFDSPHPPTLVSGEGAEIPGALAARLAGPIAPAQYAQAGPAAAPSASVGRVETVEGVITIQHVDGTRVAAAKDTPILQGDVVQTGAGAKLGIVFVDKTTMALGSDARLVIDEMVFNPASSSGSSAFSLLQGVFVIATGEIGKLNPEAVKITTPVGSIGIRGTGLQILVNNRGGESIFSCFEGSFALITAVASTLVLAGFAATSAGINAAPSSSFVLPPPLEASVFGAARAISDSLAPLRSGEAPQDVNPGSGESPQYVSPTPQYDLPAPPVLGQVQEPLAPELVPVAAPDIASPERPPPPLSFFFPEAPAAPAPAPVTAAALEDGAASTVIALPDVVNVPASLPPGVSYDPVANSFTLDPSDAAYQHLAEGAETTVTVQYQVSDGAGGTIAAQASWTVTGANDAPVVSSPVSGAATERGAPVTLDALANASDVDDGASLSVVDVSRELPAGVSFDPATHTFTLDPSNAAYERLAPGQQVTVSLDYAVSDGLAKTAAVVSWVVTGVANDSISETAAAGAQDDGSAVAAVASFAEVEVNEESLLAVDDTLTVALPDDSDDGTFAAVADGGLNGAAAHSDAAEPAFHAADGAPGIVVTPTATISIDQVGEMPDFGAAIPDTADAASQETFTDGDASGVSDVVASEPDLSGYSVVPAVQDAGHPPPADAYPPA